MISFIKKGTSTKDATATADDILFPATAYSQGEKLVGAIETVYDQSGSLREISRKGEDLYNTDDATATADDLLSPKTAYVDGGKITGGMLTTRKPGGFSNNTLETSYNIRAISIEASIVVINDNGTYKIGRIVNNGIDDTTLTNITLSGTSDMKLCYDGTNLVLFCCSSTTMYVYDIDISNLTVTLRITRTIPLGTNSYYGYSGHQKMLSRIFPMPNNPSYVAAMSIDSVRHLSVSESWGTGSAVFHIFNIIGNNANVIYTNETVLTQKAYYNWKPDVTNNSLYGYWVPNSFIVCMFENTGVGIYTVRRTVKIENNVGATVSGDTSRFYLDDNHYLINNRLYNITDGTSETVSYAENTSNGNFTMANGKIISLINGVLKLYTYNNELETIILDNSYASTDNKYLIQDGNNIVIYSSSATNKSYLMDDGNGDIIAIKRGNTTYYSTTDSDTVASQVLNKKIVYTSNGRVVGTMPNNGNLSYTPTTSSQSIPLGYTSGGTIGTVYDSSVYQEWSDTLTQVTGHTHTNYITDGLRVYYKGNLTDISGNNINGTLTGSYSISDGEVVFSGGYGTTGAINSARGSWEIYCKVNADFTPVNNSSWYNCSCIMGCELGGQQQDFGIIIDSSGYYAIGYGMSSILATDVKANDGLYHHLIIVATNSNIQLYIDGVLKATASISMSGTIPATYGIFWNNSSAVQATQGSMRLFRYYTTQFSAANVVQNYNAVRSLDFGEDLEYVEDEVNTKLLPTNIRTGVTILGVQGNLEPDKPDQTKTVIPTAAQQVVVGDTGYELASVTVESLTLSEEYGRCNELAALILGD